MTEESKILAGELYGIPIRIRVGSITGGRKTVKKEFPNRDTQTIEDLGLQPRVYNLEIIISDIGKTEQNKPPTQDYFDYRDTLISAIEAKTSSPDRVLIHPLHGRIENVVATTYSISENFSRFGESTISVTLEVNDDTGIPVQSTTALSEIVQSQSGVEDAVINDITDNFSVSTRFRNNFSDAADKVNEIIDEGINATSFLSAASDKINEFNRFIGEFSANVNSLVTAPSELALNVTNLFNNIDGLFGTVDNTVSAIKRLFGFGDNDEDNIIQTTSGKVERANNRAVLNGAMNSSALSHAYTLVSQVEFVTVDDIDEAEDVLEEQFQLVVASGASQSVKDSLTDTRVIVQSFFDAQRLTAKQVITVNTNLTSARLLAFQYYGDSDLGSDIAQLNNITAVSFVSGDIDIFTA